MAELVPPKVASRVRRRKFRPSDNPWFGIRSLAKRYVRRQRPVGRARDRDRRVPGRRACQRHPGRLGEVQRSRGGPEGRPGHPDRRSARRSRHLRLDDGCCGGAATQGHERNTRSRSGLVRYLSSPWRISREHRDRRSAPLARPDEGPIAAALLVRGATQSVARGVGICKPWFTQYKSYITVWGDERTGPAGMQRCSNAGGGLSTGC